MHVKVSKKTHHRTEPEQRSANWKIKTHYCSVRKYTWTGPVTALQKIVQCTEIYIYTIYFYWTNIFHCANRFEFKVWRLPVFYFYFFILFAMVGGWFVDTFLYRCVEWATECGVRWYVLALDLCRMQTNMRARSQLLNSVFLFKECPFLNEHQVHINGICDYGTFACACHGTTN